MFKIVVAGKHYSVPSSWNDITLEQCAWLSQQLNKQPDDIIEHYKSYMEEKLKPAKSPIVLNSFASDCISYLLKIPQKLQKKIRPADLSTLGKAMLPRFILGVIGYLDYKHQGIKHFSQKWQKYYFPKAGTDIAGEPTPLSGLTAMEACQLTDIVMSDNIEFAPLAIAIACKRKGDKYNEEQIKSLANKFKQLPASIYWELAGQVSAAHSYLQTCYKACYGKGKKAKRMSTPIWTDAMVSMSLNKPSELKHLQEMPFYDFMHMLHEHNKLKKEEWEMRAALSGCKLK